ncbi:hypothetical protein GCM10009839_06090 [Catenulispora yoronensis]|uniref:Uncharacterized protein n=1 Tax=Catenulispora yoronensis TaxID=450799 RepID=A0ABP5F190_9ACTN
MEQRQFSEGSEALAGGACLTQLLTLPGSQPQPSRLNPTYTNLACYTNPTGNGNVISVKTVTRPPSSRRIRTR